VRVDDDGQSLAASLGVRQRGGEVFGEHRLDIRLPGLEDAASRELTLTKVDDVPAEELEVIGAEAAIARARPVEREVAGAGVSAIDLTFFLVDDGRRRPSASRNLGVAERPNRDGSATKGGGAGRGDIGVDRRPPGERQGLDVRRQGSD